MRFLRESHSLEVLLSSSSLSPFLGLPLARLRPCAPPCALFLLSALRALFLLSLSLLSFLFLPVATVAQATQSSNLESRFTKNLVLVVPTKLVAERLANARRSTSFVFISKSWLNRV